MKNKSCGFEMKSVLIALVSIFLLSLSSSCATDNSNKSLFDLLRHMKASGIIVNTFSPLVPDTIKAYEAIKMKIGSSEIGVYKFDITKKKPLKKLERIRDCGYVYIIGRKYPTSTNGCFVMIDFNSNTQKESIIKAFESF